MDYFTAEVRNIMDPHQSGRVQLRIYGHHDDDKNIKDEHLPWAMPLQSITSAATAKIGTSPTGMLAGTRVVGFFLDAAKQYPIIMGTFARAGGPQDNNNNTGGQGDTDTTKNDLPGYARFDQANGTQQSNTLTPKTHKDITAKDAYNNAEFKDDKSSQELTALAKKAYANSNGNSPSLASVGKKEIKPILDMIQKIDPQKISAVLPQAVDNFQKILHISDTMSASGLSNMMGPALGNMLQSLGQNMNFSQIMSMLGQMLGTGGGSGGGSQPTPAQTAANTLNQLAGYTTPNSIIANLATEDQTILYTALIQLLDNTNPNTFVITPPPTYNQANYTVIPDPELLVTTVPDGYIQYFTFTDTDPYPGYILWEGPDGGNWLFTTRPANQPYAPDPTSDAINAAIALIEADLQKLAAQGKFDINLLLALLNKGGQAAQNQAQNNALGQNGGSMDVLTQILGSLGGLIKSAMSDHIAKSVLDTDKTDKAVQDYTKKVAITKKKKDLAKKAVEKKKDDTTNNPNEPVVSSNSSGYADVAEFAALDSQNTSEPSKLMPAAQDVVAPNGDVIGTFVLPGFM